MQSVYTVNRSRPKMTEPNAILEIVNNETGFCINLIYIKINPHIYSLTAGTITRAYTQLGHQFVGGEWTVEMLRDLHTTHDTVVTLENRYT